jgi:hypothetical protein
MDMKTKEYEEFNAESYDELVSFIRRYLERVGGSTVVVWVR